MSDPELTPSFDENQPENGEPGHAKPQDVDTDDDTDDETITGSDGAERDIHYPDSDITEAGAPDDFEDGVVG